MTLDLGSVTSQTIYVQYTTADGLQFSLDDKTWSSPPITWEPATGSTQALIATFTLGTGVTAITSNSENMVPSATNALQFLVTPTGGVDSFTVTTTAGLEASQILVSPLDLGAETSISIYVQLVDGAHQFSTDDKTWYTGPILWTPVKGSEALSATFTLGDGVSGIKTKSDNITQDGNTLTVQPTSGIDSFTVTTPKGGEDPKIVVTPQT